MIELKIFQQEAAKELSDYMLDLLSKSRGRKICTFRSPTGSGKTIMMTKAIEWVAKEEKEFELCFVWLSIGTGGLIKQSFDKVNSLIGKKLRCITLDDKLKGTPTIEGNEVLFMNWEKINSTVNKARKDGDLPNILDLMKSVSEKIKIILIIDESHRSANTERADKVREIISPAITIEMSATPVLMTSDSELHKGTCHIVSVEANKVIESELIKKEVIINENIETIQTDESTGLGIVLNAAYNKRIELEEALTTECRNINPLVLIQIPNSDMGKERINSVEYFLEEKGITYKNGKLAKMLSGDHINVENIKDGNNKVEFLIFKQAIAVGWDCPRAYILIKLREVGNEIFEIQTIGRALRMAEAFHYKNDILNVGYVYTTASEIIIDTEKSFYPNLIKHLVAKPKFKNFPKLITFYKYRVNIDIGQNFRPILTEVWKRQLEINQEFLYTHVLEQLEKFDFDVSGKDLKQSLLSDISIDIPYAIDELVGNYIGHANGEREAKLSAADIGGMFDIIIKTTLAGFSTMRSLTSVRTAIYAFFRQTLGTYYRDAGTELYICKVLLSNPKKFIDILNKTIEIYTPLRKKELSEKTTEGDKNHRHTYTDWVLGKDLYYAPTYKTIRHKLYAYKPCYLLKKRSAPEKDFEEFIDSKNDLIEWWYKNGDSGKDSFAIKYTENDKVKSFYPDYIIQMTNGNIGIFDTKSGLTAKTATAKAEALIKYSLDHFNIISGIVVPYKNTWMVHRSNKYHYDENNFEGWDTIENVLSKDKVIYY